MDDNFVNLIRKVRVAKNPDKWENFEAAAIIPNEFVANRNAQEESNSWLVRRD